MSPPVPQAQLIAQAIGQAFNVAYQQFLHASGIDPSQIGPRRRGSDDSDSEAPSQSGELFNGDLAHFSKQENCKEVRPDKRSSVRNRGGAKERHAVDLWCSLAGS